MLLHPLANPNNSIIGPLLTDYPPSGFDEHASWLNIPANEGAGLPPEYQGVDIYPVILTTTTHPPVQQYSQWGQDEIIGISADPTEYADNEAWRFGQTGNSDTSPFYTCANAKGTVSEDGRGIVFTSDMDSDGTPDPFPLGHTHDKKGNIVPRCDVFWMELK